MELPVYEGFPQEFQGGGIDCGHFLLRDISMDEVPRMGDYIELDPKDIRRVEAIVWRPSNPVHNMKVESVRIVVGSRMRVL